MENSNTLKLKAPYLIFIGDTVNPIYAKTGMGIVQWCPENVAGQFRFSDSALDLGVPDKTVAEAQAAGVKSLIIGVAPVGGAIEEHWIKVLAEAAMAGMDVVSGLHRPLRTLPAVVEAARVSGASLIDVRTPPAGLPIGNGVKRSGKRLLTVGTDCAVGKKYTALTLAASLRAHGGKATFRATGQTGIMIAGCGIAVDAVVADFISGAAEIISPDNSDDHWDIIEGQSSLFNPSYAGVSLGLLHGSQPDAIVVCHEARRTALSSCPHIDVPGVIECIDLNLRCGRLTNPDILCAGISVNTANLPAAERRPYLQALATATGLPCVDPLIDGCDAIVEKMVAAGNS